jgi:hypothetical protein
MTSRRYVFELTLADDQLEQLTLLAHTPTIGSTPAETAAEPKEALAKVLGYVIVSLCEGVRRPRSWERVVVRQLFGYTFRPLVVGAPAANSNGGEA